ncbi:MAG: serine/threonine protein kinase [Phycisphaerales bacterium]|nr:serine/threonine protein kinase [Phycisphaerales bacterium]
MRAVPSPETESAETPRHDSSGSDTRALTDAPFVDSSGNITTGGFETMLGKLIVKAGFVTPEELETCNQLLGTSRDEDSPRTLADVMIDNEYVTRRQLDRIREDFDTKKDSQRIPGYRILRKLGAGAMATVFLARQISLDRKVAIKVLPKKFSDNKNFIERFYKEGRAAAQLNHPNIVQAYDVGQAGDHHYFVMEYVDGPTVYDRIVEAKRLGEAEAVQTIIQIANALQHAHERGFIHRDIKPKNIMLTTSGRAKLADLGLARAITDKEAAEAEAGRAYGTPYYISPEQIRGELKIGPQADIYGLGATMYHMVTGRVPFEGKNPSAVMHKHLKADLVPPDHINPKLSAGCALVIEMMLAKSPGDRYQSATDLLTDLKAIADGESPHFAQRNLDLSTIAETITGPADLPPVQQREVIVQSRFSMVPWILAAIFAFTTFLFMALWLTD